jgi:hypothetical protein
MRNFLPIRSGEGADIHPTHDELVSRVNHLAMIVDQQAALITRLGAQLEKLTGQVDIHTREIGTLARGAAPEAPAPSLESATTPRKLLAYIGRRAYGKSDDTAHLPVRNALTKHAAFAKAREKYGDGITSEMDLLRYLAADMPDGRIRYQHILKLGGGQ